jgi:hypothetical protein
MPFSKKKSDVGNEEDWKALKQLTTGWIASVQNSVRELGFLYSLSRPQRVWGPSSLMYHADHCPPPVHLLYLCSGTRLMSLYQVYRFLAYDELSRI